MSNRTMLDFVNKQLACGLYQTVHYVGMLFRKEKSTPSLSFIMQLAKFYGLEARLLNLCVTLGTLLSFPIILAYYVLLEQMHFLN